ncbi:hypothetical protein CONPUDRAFT_140130 [Coniophora puteana RWD-64-598 SS2]|uniref:Uncharacterized protein n=1 Tax=Coniophora puteana (strain RWD-64-598) TaxID=741705 RepID=A0A5M3M7C4_CONPW|nr:uncharacterized protein CONPUDRAFT_140130 [Coniophora puteana RWD-64-598 SS2]EIW75149.1 hypothetical protein CONPUDRAFT_140130 [Coniophora puteana RWD-64-598 SS2]
MASVIPGSSSSVPPQQDHDTAILPVSWEGDSMFNLYIFDYCTKRGFTKTARELFQEAKLSSDSVPPINARQGLLFEWWTVFWALFTAKSSGTGTDDAMVYTQNSQNAARTGNPRFPQSRPQFPPAGPNGIPRPPGSMALNGMPNGVGPNVGDPGSRPPGGPQGGPMFNPTGPSGMQQPNGMQMPSGGGPPGGLGGPPQNFANIMPGQQRPGGPPRGMPGSVGGGPPYQSPTMANSPQTAGTPGHPSAPMGNLGHPSPHMQPMTRPGVGGGMMPPNSTLGGNAPAQTPPFSQLGHSPSRPGTPGQGGGMMHPSPSMANRPGPPGPMNEAMLSAEISRFPPPEVAMVKADLGYATRQELTFEEKQRLYALVKQRLAMRTGGKPGMPGGMPGPAGPSNPNQQMQSMHMQGQNHQGPHPLQHGQLQAQQRGGKRSSTSPGEEHNGPNTDGSPPANKRARRNSGEQQQQQQQQQPGSGTPYPQHLQPGQPGGPPGPGPHGGPQGMPNGMMRHGPGPMGGQPMNFGGPPQGPPGQGMNSMGGMGQGMGGMSPAMHGQRIMPGQGGPQGQPPQQHGVYHAQMANMHKGPVQSMMGNMGPNRPGGGPNSAPADMAQFNGVGVGVGGGQPGGPGGGPGQNMFPPGGGLQNPRVAANKGMGNMMPPPPSPRMGGPPGKDGNKDMKPGGGGGPQGAPEGSPRNPPMAGHGQGPPGGPGGPQGQQGQGQQGQGGPGQQGQGGTAPPTPSGTASSMTNPSPSPAMAHNNVPQGGPGGPPGGGGPGGPGPQGQPGGPQGGPQQQQQQQQGGGMNGQPGPPGQQQQGQGQQQQQQAPIDLFDTNMMTQMASSLDNFPDMFMPGQDGQIDFERDFADWFNMPGATDMPSSS